MTERFSIFYLFMEIVITDIKEIECITDALILPLCEGEGPIPYRDIDSALSGLIGRVMSSREFEGRHNQIALLHTPDDIIGPRRILLIGLGKRAEMTGEGIRQAGGKAASYLDSLGFKGVSLSTRYIASLMHSPTVFIEGILLSLYKFKKYRKEDTEGGIEKLTVLGRVEDLDRPIRWIEAVSLGVNFARDMVNTPSNDMTPTALSEIARGLAKDKVSVEILEREDAEREGMGAYLSVARGSMEPPKFVVLRYNGGNGPPIALIGKSITFDSGGISIKPSEGMEKMKYDMAGGAVVLAVIKVASEYELPINLIGILPAAENLPGGTASKPGDIVKTINGKTVEIINTDAEGRLALADAIGYAKKFRPRVIIDIATLTGACSVALGSEAIAMMGNDRGLMDKLRSIGDETYERVWQMPLYDEYREYLKSDIADIKNTGGKTGSLVTAAYFLREFAGDTPWVHLDIAGTAWAEKEKPYIPRGATGIGVRLLLNLLREI